MARLDLPNNLQLASKVIDYETQRSSRSLEMGWLGRALGNAAEKPGNIAGFAIVASFLILIAILWISAKDSSFRTEAVIPVFTGIITLALGYLFGKSSSN
jgi:hypothetical protein